MNSTRVRRWFAPRFMAMLSIAPVAMNYGTDAAPSLVVYYGGNDGLLRAINGNRNNPADASVGRIAATVASPAHPPTTPPVPNCGRSCRPSSGARSSDCTTIPRPSPTPRRSFPAPPPRTTAWTDRSRRSVRGGNEVHLCPHAPRRKRRICFQCDDAATPCHLQWKIGCDNGGTCRTGTGYDEYSQIGETWSSLKTLYAANYGSGTSPLLIMGGGYDPCEDFDRGVAEGKTRTPGGKNHNCTPRQPRATASMSLIR